MTDLSSEFEDADAVLYARGDSLRNGSALCAQTDPEAFFPEKGCSTRGAGGFVEIPGSRGTLSMPSLTMRAFRHWGGMSERGGACAIWPGVLRVPSARSAPPGGRAAHSVFCGPSRVNPMAPFACIIDVAGRRVTPFPADRVPRGAELVRVGRARVIWATRSAAYAQSCPFALSGGGSRWLAPGQSERTRSGGYRRQGEVPSV